MSGLQTVGDKKRRAQLEARPSPRSSSLGALRNLYLFIYNAGSAAAWLVIFVSTASIVYSSTQAAKRGGHGGVKSLWTGLSDGRVFSDLDDYVRTVQSMALLEVVHSLLGIVSAPFMTTLMQVSSRLVLVWLVAFLYPDAVATEPFYATMLLSWGATEVIRYSFFAVMISGLPMPSFLRWLRYNTFTVLYPTGISSECVCLFKASLVAAASGIVFQSRVGKSELTQTLDRTVTPVVDKLMWAILAAYVPGSYVLYSYMLKQRRRASGVRVEKKRQ